MISEADIRNLADLPGDGPGIVRLGREYEKVSEAAEEANDVIRRIGYACATWEGTAARAFREHRLTKIPPELDRVEASWGLAGGALLDFGNFLTNAETEAANHERAALALREEAIERRRQANACRGDLDNHLRMLKQLYQQCTSNPTDQSSRQRYNAGCAEHRTYEQRSFASGNQAGNAEAQLQAKLNAIQCLRDDVKDQRKACERRIDQARELGPPGESLWDKAKRWGKAYVKFYIESLAKFLEVVGKVADVLAIVATVIGLVCLAVGFAPGAAVFLGAAAILGLVGAAATFSRFGLSIAAGFLNGAFGTGIKVKRPSNTDLVFAAIAVIPVLGRIGKLGSVAGKLGKLKVLAGVDDLVTGAAGVAKESPMLGGSFNAMKTVFSTSGSIANRGRAVLRVFDDAILKPGRGQPIIKRLVETADTVDQIKRDFDIVTKGPGIVMDAPEFGRFVYEHRQQIADGLRPIVTPIAPLPLTPFFPMPRPVPSMPISPTPRPFFPPLFPGGSRHLVPC